MNRLPARWRAWSVAVLLLVLMMALPVVLKDSARLNTFTLILIAAQLGVAWNIVGGYAGQVSLGHAAFFGIGAYTSTLLLLNFGIPSWLGVIAGGVMAVLASLLVGWSCFRLKGHYFAMATIAVAEIVQIMVSNWDYAGASIGLYLPLDQTGWRTLIFNSRIPYYYLALGLLLVSLLINRWIAKSWIGYYLHAIKDEPDAARSLGVNLRRYKQFALLASSFLTAMGGSLYALKELYIDPASMFGTGLSIKMSLVSILGGVGTLFGPVIGAAILTVIEETSRIVFGGTGRGIDLIIYASLIILIAIYCPTGIMGWWRERRTSRHANQPLKQEIGHAKEVIE